MTVLLRLSAGLIAWAVAFCLIYALHGVGCANGWPARTIGGYGVHRVSLVAAWLGMLAVTVAIAVRLSRRRVTILDRVAMGTGWAGAAATAITFVPILAIDQCL